jgi:hypothetical protein
MISKVQAIGAATLLGITASGAVAVQNPNPLETSSNVEQFRGALSGVTAPELDGPVVWKNPDMGKLGAMLIIGGSGAFVGLAAAKLADERRVLSAERGVVLFPLLGALIGGGVGVAIGHEPYREIKFQTQVSQIVMTDAPHMERHGKVSRGPYYSQIVSIPETDIFLQTNHYQVPLVDGQKINATFWVKESDQSIVCWQATRAPRD